MLLRRGDRDKDRAGDPTLRLTDGFRREFFKQSAAKCLDRQDKVDKGPLTHSRSPPTLLQKPHRPGDSALPLRGLNP